MPGMLADLAVLSDDYFTVPISDIAKIKSLLTMVGGQIVYASGPFSSLEVHASLKRHSFVVAKRERCCCEIELEQN